MTAPRFGAVAWHDLTVPDAESLAGFYAKVVGWTVAPVDMGGYSDFEMRDASGGTAAGICHARGTNAKLPPQWLVYIVVPDVREAARRCADLGGTVLDGPRPLAGGTFCAIRDPAGAVAALFEEPRDTGAVASPTSSA